MAASRFAGSRLPGFLALIALAACASAPPKSPEAPAVATQTPATKASTRPVSGDPSASPPPYTCNAEGSLLASLSSPLRITAYVTTGTPDLDTYTQAIRDFLERLKTAGAPNVDYTIVDTAGDKARDAAFHAQMRELDTVAIKNGVPVHIYGFMGLVFEYRGKVARIDAPPTRRALEYIAFDKLRRLRERAERTRHRVGVLTGHGEIGFRASNLAPASSGPPKSAHAILATYFPTVDLVDVDLTKSTLAIDETLDGLIITQPTTDLPSEHLRRIDQFVTKGKTLVVAASAVNLQAEDTSMQGTLSAHGLEDLLAGYGIEMRADVIEEFGRAYGIPVETKNGRTAVRFPPILDVIADERFTNEEALLDKTFPAFVSAGHVYFPYASSLVLHPERQPDVPASSFRVLARSTPSAMRDTGADVDLKAIRQWRPKGPFRQYDIAVSVEGPLRSAFGGSTKNGSRAATSRVLVLSSSQFFANPFVHANRPTSGDMALEQFAMVYANDVVAQAMVLVLVQTLDWVSMDRALAACVWMRE